MAFGFGKKAKSGWGARPAPPPRAGRGRQWAGHAALLLGLWAAGVAVLQLGGPQRHAGLADGQRAPATVVAAVDFDCVNVAATDLLRRQAADSVVPVFGVQMGPLQATWRNWEKLADRVVALRRQAAAAPTGAATNAAAQALATDLAVVADLLGLSASGEDLAALFPSGKEMDVLGALKDGLAGVWTNGILSELDRESGFQGLFSGPAIDLVPPGESGERAPRTVRLADLPSAGAALDLYRAAALKRLQALDVEAPAAAVEALARPSLRPNLDYDAPATQARRAAAQHAVEPVKMTVRAGTTLMEEGTTVLPQTVEMIDAYNRRMAQLESPRERRVQRTGDALLLLVALALCAGWLHGSLPGAYASPRRKWLLALLGLLAIALASLYRYLSIGLNWIPPWLAPYAVPIALPAFLAVLLLGAPSGLAVGLWGALAAALAFGRSFELLWLGLGSAVLAALLLRNVRKRAQVMRAGLAAGALASALALVLAVLARQMPATALAQMGTALAAGLFSAVVALLLLPFLEWSFRHVTGISLLELTDMSHPLLQRLALEDPGTYHHSLMVGAIGQAAANRIGADGLLVLVSAYFHDVGKLAKPEFFSENQRGGENPHDGLAPSMSALVIQSHVKEGLTLAKRYKLPQPVCDALRAHHGTTLTSYFYQVARRSLQDAGLAEDAGLESSYRYDGPKPWTREQAVLMLADSVEAASRSLEKPTPHRIAEMVDGLLRDKLLDGQLDLCPLTLAELHEVRAAFTFALANVLHGRNPYPRENPSAQPAAGAAGPVAGGPAADPDAREPGVSG